MITVCPYVSKSNHVPYSVLLHSLLSAGLNVTHTCINDADLYAYHMHLYSLDHNYLPHRCS